MTGFDDATLLRPVGDGAFAWDVPDGWQQGRGAWGGLVVGAMVRALTVQEPAPVRSVSVQISTPAVVGEQRVEVAVLRRGTSMTTWRASITSAAGVPVASMVAITGVARSSSAASVGWGVTDAPVLPPAVDVPVVPVTGPIGPVFAQHVEFRPVHGLPLSGSHARTAGWVRLQEPASPTSAWLLALVDAWWPASMPAFTDVVRIATVNFTANLLVEPATIDPGVPLAYDAHVSGAVDGFTSEHRSLWTSDGRLAVDNLQTIVVG